MPSTSKQVFVLRMGHRLHRDQRVTTHVCLTARALGANGVYVADTHDGQLVENVNRVSQEFGGTFTVETGLPWRTTVSNWKKSGGQIVHLTAYGLPLKKIIAKIRRSNSSKLLIVGAEKMPGEIFQLADWNVSVTNQPISEVSALGIFLDWYFKHQLRENIDGARIRILPSEHGKRVLTI